MRAAHELSGAGLPHPEPALKAYVVLAKLHRPLTSHFLPWGLKVWKERFPLPCIPKYGTQVNTMPQKQGILPSLCKSCRHLPHGSLGTHLASRPAPCRKVEPLSRRAHTPCSSSMWTSCSLSSLLNKSCMDLIVILEEVGTVSWHSSPAKNTHGMAAQHCTQVCEAGSQPLLGLAQGSKTASTDSESHMVLDPCEGVL